MISIIVPNYNNPSLLKQCLKSIIEVEPDDKKYEIIVVDDGSSEDNLEQIRALCKRPTRLIEHGSNRYFSQAVNTGIGAARGEIVVLMNSDVICSTPFIDSLEDAFARDAKIGIIGAVLYYGDMTIQHAGVNIENGWWRHTFCHDKLPEGHPALRSTFYPGVTGAFFAIRRECFEDIGLYDTDYVGAYEDIEYCIRAWTKGWRVYLETSIRAFHLEGKTRGANLAEKMHINPYLWYREQITTKKLRKLMTPETMMVVQNGVAEARKKLL